MVKESVYASPRKERIQSKGNINYEQGKVFFSTQDLLYLADEIDDLEKKYKVNLVDSLNYIGSYFKTDGTVVYDPATNEVKEEEEKMKITLGQITRAIRESQSVSQLSGTQALNPNQQPLFYTSEKAGTDHNHLEISTTDNGHPLLYKAATAENLSAGCTAWVNGVLLKGNGSDNEKFREIGYRQGYSQGVAEALNKVNVVYTYHEHVGSSNVEGGCYGYLTGTQPVLCGCNSYVWADYDGNGTATCANCWHNHGSRTCDAVETYQTYGYIGLICNKTTDTIESATIQY